jgi:ABC-type nitrate/sulfonate/bicarbonate transport system substrate-binding protein
MSKRRIRRAAGLVASLIAVSLAWQGFGAGLATTAAAASADDVTVIRYFNNRGSVSIYEIADALGWLKDKHIRIESEGYSQGGPENLVGLASDSVDIAGVATPPLINAIASGAKIVGVMPDGGINADVNSKFFVLAGSDVKTAEDLKDRSIAVNTLGAHLDYTTREYVRDHRLGADAVKLITIPGPQLDLVLRHKQVDVVAVGAWQSVFAGKIQAEGGVRVLFTDYQVLGNIVLGNDAMKKSFIAQHSQAVRDFVTACAKAADWTAAHPDEAKKLFADILRQRGDNPELAKYWPGYGMRPHALYTDHDVQFWIDVLVREGRLERGQFTPADIATNRYNDLANLAQK